MARLRAIFHSNWHLAHMELAQAAPLFPAYEFVFVDRTILDLSKPESFHAIINEIGPDAIINTAAYTAVDKAEIEKEVLELTKVKVGLEGEQIKSVQCQGDGVNHGSKKKLPH